MTTSDGTKKPADLIRTEYLSASEWDHAKPAESLDRAADQLVFKVIKDAGDWYFKNKFWKKIFGQWIRILSWILGGFVAIVPVLSQMYPDWKWLKPGYATIALLVAGGLIWLDRFFGFTSGWMRYIEAAMKLRQLQDRLSIEWAVLRSAWSGGTPSQAQIVEALEFLKNANAQHHAIVGNETAEWMAEFRSALKMLEQSIEKRAEEAGTARGAIRVKIANLAAIDRGWTLIVNDRVVRRGETGDSAVITDLPPAQYRVRVEAKITSTGTNGATQTRPVEKEDLVGVEGGKTAETTFTFS